MHNFRRLLVWQKAHAATVGIERLASQIPRRDNAELISQLRRAAFSVPTNIVHACGRVSDAEFARYLGIACASAKEVEYHLQLAADTDRAPRDKVVQYQADMVEIQKMLTALIRRATK